jgi:EAL domain-containing protein (putative c-di-GMP-specific phosphodiesterase class I)
MHDTAILEIAKLRAMGVRISIDDFGTGYSSLGYLQRIPVDEVKLDKSLMDGLDTGNNAPGMLNAIVILAHTLNLAVVGEGIETNRQWDALAQVRCDVAQGYYICQPVGTEDIEEWLGEEESRHPLRYEASLV